MNFKRALSIFLIALIGTENACAYEIWSASGVSDTYINVTPNGAVISASNPAATSITTAGNIIDNANSTVTPLAASGVFTGGWTNTLKYTQIEVSLLTDQNATLQVEFSNNGSAVAHTHSYAVVANTGKTVQVQPHGSYYRLNLTNGGTPETSLNLQSSLHPIPSPGTIIEVGDVPTTSDDAALTKSVITGASVDGSGYKNVATTQDGGLVINQNTTIDTTNSTTANLAAGASFVGAAKADRPYTAVQFTVKSDQNLFVYVDQSPDGINWDITDSFEFYSSEGGTGNTVQLVASYYRVRVTNVGAATTTFLRLQTIDIPFLPSLPRALDLDGNLKVSIQEGIMDESGFSTTNSPDGELMVSPSVQLTGGTFATAIIDPAYWTASSGVGGTAAITNAELVLATGTTANNAASAVSSTSARFISGSSNKFHTEIRFPDAASSVNNTRRWGPYNATSGAHFDIVNGALCIGTRLNSVDTLKCNGAFNGELGTAIVMNANLADWFVTYSTQYVWFYLNGKLLDTEVFPQTNWTSSYNLPITFENINTGGSTTNVQMIVRNAHIHRLGQPLSQARGYFQQGLTAGVTLKQSAGNMHGIILSGITNNSVLTVYDNTAASGTVIWTSGPLTSNGLPFFVDMKGLAFSNGLTITVTGAALNALVMYE